MTQMSRSCLKSMDPRAQYREQNQQISPNSLPTAPKTPKAVTFGKEIFQPVPKSKHNKNPDQEKSDAQLDVATENSTQKNEDNSCQESDLSR